MADIRWFGHNCFRIRAREATILTDPVSRTTGYVLPKQTADIVTLSHEQDNLSAVKPGYKLVNGPGEYEIHGVFIHGIRTFSNSEQSDGGRIFNTAYLFEVEGIVLCHLGDLVQTLTDDQAEALNNVDVLFIPAGGGDVLPPSQAAEVIAMLEPKVVIPMRYATAKGDKSLGDLEQFCKQLGVAAPTPVDKLVLRQSDLTETMRIIALNPET